MDDTDVDVQIVTWNDFDTWGGYRREALKTAPDVRTERDARSALAHAAAGIGAETRELVDAIHRTDAKAQIEERGDVMWYLAIADDAVTRLGMDPIDHPFADHERTPAIDHVMRIALNLLGHVKPVTWEGDAPADRESEILEHLNLISAWVAETWGGVDGFAAARENIRKLRERHGIEPPADK